MRGVWNSQDNNFTFEQNIGTDKVYLRPKAKKTEI